MRHLWIGHAATVRCNAGQIQIGKGLQGYPGRFVQQQCTLLTKGCARLTMSTMTARGEHFLGGTTSVAPPDGDDLLNALQRDEASLVRATESALTQFGYSIDAFRESGEAKRLPGTVNPNPASAYASDDSRTWPQTAPELEQAAKPQSDVVLVVTQRDISKEWQVRWLVAEQGGHLVVRSVTLEPLSGATPSGGVTASLLRELKPRYAIDAASPAVPEPLQPGIADDLIAAGLRDAFTSRHASGPVAAPEPRRGRPPLSDEHLARVAMSYLRELKRGPGILARLAAEFGRTEQAMRDQVSAAREREWLGPAPRPGQKGGGPGRRLQELLAAAAERDAGNSNAEPANQENSE